MHISLADERGAAARPVDSDRLEALARSVLADRGVPDSLELGILLVDEARIADLNERFLGHEGPTDVLSFPIDGSALPAHTGEAPPLLLGDVVICPEVASRNATEHASSYEDELALLLVHGILHLLGMDHEDDHEAEAMEALEAELLQRHGRLRRESAAR